MLMTATHTRPKGYSELHQAKPYALTTRNLFAYEKETVRLVNDAHKAFWKKRGFLKSPSVSKEIVGIFELPNEGGINERS